MTRENHHHDRLHSAAGPITLDGSAGEGGGQILRTGLALSMCTGRPLRIDRIRAGRPKPGLMRQHLACVNAARAVSGATVEGDVLGATSLTFEPGAVRAGDFHFAVGSAGSCTLVLQTVLPALLVAAGESRLVLSGGTHNPMAPPFHFLDRSFLPLLRRTGAEVDVSLRRHGFHPAGGGEVHVTVRPAAEAATPFDLLERGAFLSGMAECIVPGLPRVVAQRELGVVGESLGWGEGQLRIVPTRQNEGPGNALLVTLNFEHVTEVFMAVGERGRPAEDVARGVVSEVQAYQAASGAAGPHLADQLALPLALAVQAAGRAARYSVSEVTEHTRTNLDVISRFLAVSWHIEAVPGGAEVRIVPRAEAA